MKLPRFHIRDLFWLMLVVALALGWWINHRQDVRRNGMLEAKTTSLERELRFIDLFVPWMTEALEREGYEWTVSGEPGHERVILNRLPLNGFNKAHRNALVTAAHTYAKNGQSIHLAELLAEYPDLVDCRQESPGNSGDLGDKLTRLHFAPGLTPLHLAAGNGHLETVKRLVAAGASPHELGVARGEVHSPTTVQGSEVTPLQVAELNGHTDVVAYLESLP